MQKTEPLKLSLRSKSSKLAISLKAKFRTFQSITSCDHYKASVTPGLHYRIDMLQSGFTGTSIHVAN